jgi:hypothetical protein
MDKKKLQQNPMKIHAVIDVAGTKVTVSWSPVKNPNTEILYPGGRVDTFQCRSFPAAVRTALMELTMMS